jgi:hypothetical protein
VITLDAYAASHRAVRELKSEGSLPRRVRLRSNKYLNNVVEQDHRRVKQRTGPMLGFKRFDTATITISGIELAEKIKKAQFKRKTGGSIGHSAGNLGGCSGRLKPSKRLTTCEAFNPSEICTTAFLSRHWDQIVATDFFTIEVWTASGLDLELFLKFFQTRGRGFGRPPGVSFLASESRGKVAYLCTDNPLDSSDRKLHRWISSEFQVRRGATIKP